MAYVITLTSLCICNHFVNRCPNSGPKTTNCRAANSDKVVSKKCNGKSGCHVPANNHYFGDPCRGTVKYLEVAYVCGYWGKRLRLMTKALFTGAVSTVHDEIKYTLRLNLRICEWCVWMTQSRSSKNYADLQRLDAPYLHHPWYIRTTYIWQKQRLFT